MSEKHFQMDELVHYRHSIADHYEKDVRKMEITGHIPQLIGTYGNMLKALIKEKPETFTSQEIQKYKKMLEEGKELVKKIENKGLEKLVAR